MEINKNSDCNLATTLFNRLKNQVKVVALALFGHFRDCLFFIFLNIYLIHFIQKIKYSFKFGLRYVMKHDTLL